MFLPFLVSPFRLPEDFPMLFVLQRSCTFLVAFCHSNNVLTHLHHHCSLNFPDTSSRRLLAFIEHSQDFPMCSLDCPSLVSQHSENILKIFQWVPWQTRAFSAPCKFQSISWSYGLLRRVLILQKKFLRPTSQKRLEPPKLFPTNLTRQPKDTKKRPKD